MVSLSFVRVFYKSCNIRETQVSLMFVMFYNPVFQSSCVYNDGPVIHGLAVYQLINKVKLITVWLPRPT